MTFQGHALQCIWNTDDSAQWLASGIFLATHKKVEGLVLGFPRRSIWICPREVLHAVARCASFEPVEANI